VWQSRFFCATGAEPGAVDYTREMLRLREKIDAGAEIIMTQASPPHPPLHTDFI
jgi:5,10-methylenetetrahydrofolate reductase